MTDHGTPRPQLPDPQQDRHVSFPDDALDQPPPVTSLPPEAWAPRPTEPAPAQAPLVRRRSNHRGAGWLVALVVVPLFLGIANSGAGGSLSADDGGYSVEMDGGHRGDSGAYGGEWMVIEPVADEGSVAARLPGATTVQGVPAETTRVRIEVVGNTGDTVGFEILGPDGVLESTTDEPLPLARTATHAPGDHLTMHVHAKGASRDSELQCRIYAGTVLVALDTARSHVTCTITW